MKGPKCTSFYQKLPRIMQVIELFPTILFPISSKGSKVKVHQIRSFLVVCAVFLSMQFHLRIMSQKLKVNQTKTQTHVPRLRKVTLYFPAFLTAMEKIKVMLRFRYVNFDIRQLYWFIKFLRFKTVCFEVWYFELNLISLHFWQCLTFTALRNYMYKVSWNNINFKHHGMINKAPIQ